MLKARDYFPAVKHGAKWTPEDFAGMLGQPVVGNIFYVDPTNGSDTANSGTSWDDAFATVSQAYDTATDNNYDVIVLAPGTHTASTESSSITWSKDHITLVGAVAPVHISQRARILAAASVSPLITISGYGNRFLNLQIATYEDNDELVAVTGSRNYFGNVHFAGMGNQTTADTDTTPYCVKLNGGSENTFVGCTFGLDTVERAGDNGCVLLDASAARNAFYDCLFVAWVDDTDPSFVKQVDASGADRWTLFKNCVFNSGSTNEGSTMASVFDIPASPQTHRYLLSDSYYAGAGDWDENDRGDVFANMVAAAASAAGGAMTSQ